MGSHDDTQDMGAMERMGSLMTTKASAIKHKLANSKDDFGSDYTIDPSDTSGIIKDWPAAPRKVAEKLIDNYGEPNEATPTKMFWYNQGNFTRIVLTKDEIVHNFPTAHTDFLSQYIKYKVPAEKASELAAFDGSVLIDRTAGEVGARCDHEAYNILTLNLVHEIVQGIKTVEQARKLYAETAAAFTMGRPAPYAEKLLFELPAEDTTDPDEGEIGGAMANQSGEKIKDAVSDPDERQPSA